MNKIDFTKIDLNAEAPAAEPERQYYYIAKAIYSKHRRYYLLFFTDVGDQKII